MDGWWKLSIKPRGCTLNDVDKANIARLIVDGFTEGEIVHE